MKIITANRLSDGAVVYLAETDIWATLISQAAVFDDEDIEATLAAVNSRITEITDAYAIDVTAKGLPAGRSALRETIRITGPSIFSDLNQNHQAAQ